MGHGARILALMVSRYAPVPRLRALRRARTLSQQALAGRVDPPIAIRTIQLAEATGQTTPLTARRLADALGVAVADLAGEMQR